MKTLLLTLGILLTIGNQISFANGGAPLDAPKSTANTAPQFFNERIAQEMKKSIGPISKEALMGRWRKVVQGPIGESLGFYQAGGVAEGDNRSALELEFSSNVMNWLPENVGVQLLAVADHLPTIKINPSLIANPIEVRLEGQLAKFKLSYVYKGSYPYVQTEYGHIYDSKYNREASYSLSVTLSLECGLQNDNPNRMICTQKGEYSGEDSRHSYGCDEKEVGLEQLKNSTGISAKFIGFERVQ
jgi:hypothetical protein